MAPVDRAAPGTGLREAGRAGRWALRRVVVLGLALLFVFPFLVMLTTAFKLPDDIFHAPPRLLPSSWTWDNFTQAFQQMPVWRYLGNTLFVSAATVVGTLIACPLVAYSLSKLRWRGRSALLAVVLATMMLPPQITMIPVYLLWNALHAGNTYWPLITPAFFGTPFLIFMIRQFLMSVPDELIAAARLDGASELRIYLSIVLPLARPALVTSAVFQFVWTWTDFLNPLIYLNDSEKYTLSIGLYAFFGEHDIAWGPLMAACVMFTMPALLIFIFGQRYFVGGISAGAFK
ncbi:carbohydrate ABC transporter permease [Nonomuraea pusilla]|uniref:Carbohydrate ABC transporter membrane protein 2, CUT1 family (TC 3.A.1.1.-) n=1 Tax=Nonomuraea pusilla TaxID=46177 RepID=A0A1H7NI16_9ACTN|nr:carbohydrate ABC transporter permease [Nonomuraea pusilla]SEL22959.1 carbohydrate ABC transporter membrane protein 2, CUT1 family (TC 3.A.1.1.-) [Nonomuraea pusilla]